MAHAGKKFGPGQQDQGKGDGSGGMSPDTAKELPDNEVLSNRDKSRHSEQRGLDSRHVQNQQHHDHIGNREPGKANDENPENTVEDEP